MQPLIIGVASALVGGDKVFTSPDTAGHRAHGEKYFR